MNMKTYFDWYVVQLKPNCYNKAKTNLEKQRIDTFLPLIESTKTKTSKFVTELRPLFPGYIFVSFDKTSFRWTAINNTFGVKKLISQNHIPQPLPEGFINGLKARCNKMGQLIVKENPILGEKVKLLRGPFVNLVGVVETIEPQKRVTLLLEFMGQKTKTTVYSSHLRRLN